MSSVQGYNSPATLTEEPEEEYIEYQQDQPEYQVEHPPAEHELHPEQEHQPESKPIASSSYSQALDRLSDMPPKDGNIGGRVSVADPTVLVESPPVGIVTLQDSNPPRSSQVIDWRNVTQTSLSGAVELMAVNANRPDDPQMTNATSARPPINQPVAAGDDGTGNNIDPNANGSTSNATNRNTGTGGRTTVARPDLASTSNVSLNPSRSQAQLAPSRPLSILERRPTGPGLVSYDPIRGDATTQVYLQDANGEGDPAGVPNRPGSRNTIMRVSVARPRSVLSPTDGIAVGDGPGPGSRRASRLVSGQDFLAGVPVIEEPPKEKTVASRLKPTIDAAMMERDKFRKRSSQQGILINGAIGLQVIVGALTTGIAAAGSAHIGAAVATLGGISTILASYLAKVRGSGEPELSTIRTRELNSFLREVEGFLVDHGEETGTDQDDKIATFREQFESIIKTDGEDSGSGTGNSQLPQSSIPPQYTVPVPVRLANGQPGMGQIPIPVHPANGHVYPVQCIHCLDEKQQLWRNEKVINGVA